MKWLSFLVTLLLIFNAQASNYSRDYIRIIGSTSFYPIITRLAEDFAIKTNSKVPVVEATGTGAGFQIFCMGNGVYNPDIVMASREMKDSEKSLCETNGIKNIQKLIVAKDALVFVTNKKFKISNLSQYELAILLSDDDIENFKDLGESFPDLEVKFYGPGSNSSNFDAILEMVIRPNLGVNAKIRNDQRYIQNGTNNNIIISKIIENKNSIGIIPIEYFMSHKSKLKMISIDGVLPSHKSIKDNTYPLSRSLILYFSKDKFNLVKDLDKFLDFVLSRKL